MFTRDRQDIGTTLLDAAVLAPSMHNTQPWRFEVGSRTVRVYRDLERWLRTEDPDQTALCISLGAVVLNLRVAAAELGYLAHVSLLPDPRDDDHVATLTLAAGLGYDMELRPLFAYLRRRRTNRTPFGDRPVPAWVLRDLEAAARAEHGVLQVVRDPARVRLLLGLAAEGSTNELFELAKLEERARWVGGHRRHDGIPASALGPIPADSPSVVRDLAVRQADRQRPTARFEPHPLLALLSVRRDDRLGWLTAGQALERVLLAAARWGLSASFLNQALASEQMTWLGNKWGEAALCPQMVLRLGYGSLSQPSPRRPLADFTSHAPLGR